MQTYEQRLRIPIIGSNISLYLKNGEIIANGYIRIVIGGRGPYVEFSQNQLNENICYLPENQRWRVSSPLVYWIEYRTIRENIKIYYQKNW